MLQEAKSLNMVETALARHPVNMQNVANLSAAACQMGAEIFRGFSIRGHELEVATFIGASVVLSRVLGPTFDRLLGLKRK